MLYINSNGTWKGDSVMFSHFFGNYLVRKGKLTEHQFREILLFQKTTARVKLELIAVASHLLTTAQVEEINRMQTTKDKRFGDIAVEKGYLTDSQVETLKKQQGNPYMVFTQAAVERGFFSLDEISQMLSAFQQEYSLTDNVLVAIKDGDTDTYARQFMQIDDPLFFEHFSLFLQNIILFIQPDIYFESAYRVDSYDFDTLASQTLTGTHQIFVGLAGKEKNLLKVATPYACEDFDEIDEDAFDSVCEFINTVNGLFARNLYEESIEEDMQAPLFYTNQTLLSSGLLYILPVYIDEARVDIVIGMDQHISFK